MNGYRPSLLCYIWACRALSVCMFTCKQLAQASGEAAPSHADADAAADPLSFGPRPDALMPRTGAAAAASASAGANGAAGGVAGTGLGPGDGVYRPPRLNPVAMAGEGEDDPDRHALHILALVQVS